MESATLPQPQYEGQSKGQSQTSLVTHWSHSWPLERVLFAMAGTMTLLSAVLAATVSPWFLLLTGFVAVSQWLYVATGACPASLMIGKVFGVRTACGTGASR